MNRRSPSTHRRRALASLALALGVAAKALAGTMVTPALVPPPPALAGVKSYVLMDFRTGAILASKDPQLQLPPASLTKLMTAYLSYGALADGRLHWHQRIPVSDVAWHTGGSSMFIQPNLPVTVDQLMHGLIIDSGNDAAVALAQAVAGSRTAFVADMNAEAARLGLKGAHYTDVDGLPDPGLHLSAMNIAQLSRDLIARYPQVLQISRIHYYRYNHITQRSWNPALFGHPHVDGLKTGHTHAAGHCMDTTIDRHGRRLIAVVMGAPSWPAGVHDVMRLFDYAYRFTHDHELLKAGQIVGNYRDDALDPDHFPVKAAQAVWVSTFVGQAQHIKRVLHYDQLGGRPVTVGMPVGSMRFELNGRVLARTALLAAAPAQPAGTLGTLWNRIRAEL
ncbi:MAG: serine hydrolase [Acidithiobacillus sp.]